MVDSLLHRLIHAGVIVICRKIYGQPLLQLANALYRGGIRQMEITFDQSDPEHLSRTTEAIKTLCTAFPDMDIGAGTVLNREQAKAAAEAGARFLVSPHGSPDLIRFTREQGLISIPGAMTPSEVTAAFEAGGNLIKLFPAGYLGSRYVRDLTAPLSHIPLLATAGINENNFADFLQAGCCGAGISSVLTDPAAIAAEDWDLLTARAKHLLDIYHTHKG